MHLRPPHGRDCDSRSCSDDCGYADFHRTLDGELLPWRKAVQQRAQENEARRLERLEEIKSGVL